MASKLPSLLVACLPSVEYHRRPAAGFSKRKQTLRKKNHFKTTLNPTLFGSQ
jgi:hypothetical protein